MSAHAEVHAPVGGKLMTRPFMILLAVAAVGALVALYRFVNGIGSVSNLSNGYPWGIWIAIDVVVGTAIGCGGYAVGLLVYILNKGQYHPLVRAAVLTSLLGYGLAVIAVMIDLGRYWALWKVPIFVWRWSHSPQLEVALCVAAYTLVLMIELSPALFEKWRDGASSGARRFATGGLKFVEKNFVWLLALGLLLPTMHQSSLGTMMLLPGPRMNPLWFTPWLPLLFLVNAIIMGFAVVVLEATFSSVAFGRKRETAMLASLSYVAAWVALGWAVFRVGEVAIAGKLHYLASGAGIAFLFEVGLLVLGAGILLTARRNQASWQVRGAIILFLGTAFHRVNTYLIAFNPGANYSYFPALPELLITLGIIAAEVAIYIAVVKTFPILAGAPSASASVRRAS
ncbi:MAG: NrfD/PsrC family molybdoenzyme membrane anchor subunit [Acidobacteriota bacterium]